MRERTQALLPEYLAVYLSVSQRYARYDIGRLKSFCVQLSTLLEIKLTLWLFIQLMGKRGCGERGRGRREEGEHALFFRLKYQTMKCWRHTVSP